MRDQIVVIGLGNLYMGDDGIGIRVARALQEMNLREDVSVLEHAEMNLSIIETFQGASKLIIVDSVKGGKKPGTVSQYTITGRKGDLDRLSSLHSLKLTDIIDLAISAGILTCPIIIIGVEPKNVSLGEGLSPEVERALPQAVEAVIREL